MRLFLKCVLILGLLACSSETDNEGDTKRVPQSISYSPNSISVVFGSSVSSSLPTVNDGGVSVTNYSIISAPAGISINSTTGIITSANTTMVGSHKLSIELTNEIGKKSFSNVYSINVTAAPTAPTSLSYGSLQQIVYENNSKTFSPTIQDGGSTVTSYALVNNSTAITINSQTGVLTVPNTLGINDYSLEVSVTNDIGTMNFILTNVIKVIKQISFATIIQPIINDNCAGSSCHVGGPKIDISVYQIAKDNINNIKAFTANNSMPPDSNLPQSEKDLITEWQKGNFAQ